MSEPARLEVAPTIEELYSEWSQGFYEKLKGNLRQARAAAALETHYGKGSVSAFAGAMRTSEQVVYDYAAMWRRLVSAYPSENEIFGRLEDSPLSIWKIIEGTRGVAPQEIPATLDAIEDENPSVSKIRQDRQENGKPKNVEVIAHIVCPECGALSPMSAVETREVEG